MRKLNSKLNFCTEFVVFPICDTFQVYRNLSVASICENFVVMRAGIIFTQQIRQMCDIKYLEGYYRKSQTNKDAAPYTAALLSRDDTWHTKRGTLIQSLAEIKAFQSNHIVSYGPTSRRFQHKVLRGRVRNSLPSEEFFSPQEVCGITYIQSKTFLQFPYK
jgi:hypothetical protein